MMEVRIKNKDKIEIIKLRDPTGKHQREWFNELVEAQKGEIKGITGFLDFRDKIIIDLSESKITKEELENMSLIEKNKLTKAIEACFTLVENSESGFTKS